MTATPPPITHERGEPIPAPDWTTLNLVGESGVFRRAGAPAKWAPVDATVLIRGETGTGKELAARASTT